MTTSTSLYAHFQTTARSSARSGPGRGSGLTEVEILFSMVSLVLQHRAALPLARLARFNSRGRTVKSSVKYEKMFGLLVRGLGLSAI